jgi:hypothetical protein
MSLEMDPASESLEPTTPSEVLNGVRGTLTGGLARLGVIEKVLKEGPYIFTIPALKVEELISLESLAPFSPQEEQAIANIKARMEEKKKNPDSPAPIEE